MNNSKYGANVWEKHFLKDRFFNLPLGLALYIQSRI